MTREAYEQVTNAPHEAKLSHELIAAAAAYQAAKAWNDHKEKNGEEVSHGTAKEVLAGAAGFFIDRLVETKGLDAIDKYRAKQEAEKHYKHHYNDD